MSEARDRGPDFEDRPPGYDEGHVRPPTFGRGIVAINEDMVAMAMAEREESRVHTELDILGAYAPEVGTGPRAERFRQIRLAATRAEKALRRARS